MPPTLGEVATPKGVDGEGKAAGGEGKPAVRNHDLMFIDHFFKILIDE